MEKHWDNYCTMSIVHFMAFPATMPGEAPMLESISKIAGDPFFGGIEIGWMKDAQERARVRKVLEVAHMGVRYAAQSALTLQKLNINSLDDSQRQRAVEQLLRSIDEAAEMGADRVGFLSGIDPGEADRTKALDALAKSTRQAAAYAQDKGIQLVLETFDYDIDKKCLIGPNDLAAEFCQRIRQDFPGFGLLCRPQPRAPAARDFRLCPEPGQRLPGTHPRGQLCPRSKTARLRRPAPAFRLAGWGQRCA